MKSRSCWSLATVALTCLSAGSAGAQQLPTSPPTGVTPVISSDDAGAGQPPTTLPPVGVTPAPVGSAPAGPPGAYGSLVDLTCDTCPQPAPESPPNPYAGPLFDRKNLTGDWFGARSAIAAKGITWDVSSTQFYSGVTSQGVEQRFRYRGRNDYFLNIDGQKLGLWEGLFVNVHGESVYGDSVNNLTGTLIPVSIGQALPTPQGSTSALTGVKVTQALSENFLVYFGKINTLDGFNQPFTGGAYGINGFMNAALTIPVIAARTTPYSTYGAGFAVLKDAQPVFAFTVLDTNNTPTTSGFDTFFNNGVTLLGQVNIPTNFFGLPGHQGLLGAYSNGRYTELSRSAFLSLIPGLPAAPEKKGSWFLNYAFDQALHVDPCDATRTWGVFGNLGIADQNPSPIRWAANIGVGGASPIAGRKNDSFGVGYFYVGLSSGLKNLAPRLVPLGDEQGVEAFYNIGVTPWCHITPDLQVLIPARDRINSPIFFGLRAKIDF